MDAYHLHAPPTHFPLSEHSSGQAAAATTVAQRAASATSGSSIVAMSRDRAARPREGRSTEIRRPDLISDLTDLKSSAFVQKQFIFGGHAWPHGTQEVKPELAGVPLEVSLAALQLTMTEFRSCLVDFRSLVFDR